MQALCDALVDAGGLVASDGSIVRVSRIGAVRHRIRWLLGPWWLPIAPMIVLLAIRGGEVWLAALGGGIALVLLVPAVQAPSRRTRGRDALCLIALPNDACRLLGAAPHHGIHGAVPHHLLSRSSDGLVVTIADDKGVRQNDVVLREVSVSVELTVAPSGAVLWCCLRSPDASAKVRGRGRLDLGAPAVSG